MAQDDIPYQSKYFAALPQKAAVAQCEARVESWGGHSLSNSYLEKVRKSWFYYHGNFSETGSDHQLSVAGDQGELTKLAVNHYRNIADHLLNLTTANRPAMQARAVNTDLVKVTLNLIGMLLLVEC
jgi:hypothetical protein